MTPATKNKIERMAEFHFSNVPEDLGLDEIVETHKQTYKTGATPWAEWCERFQEHARHDQWCFQQRPKGFCCCGLENLKAKYQAWLEESDENS